MSKVIAPTVGRVLWYFPKTGDLLTLTTRPCAAIIAHVNEDGTLNVNAHDHYGNTAPRQNVPLVQDDEDDSSLTGRSYCRWMPYQLGQAARTDDALAQLGQARLGGDGPAEQKTQSG